MYFAIHYFDKYFIKDCITSSFIIKMEINVILKISFEVLCNYIKGDELLQEWQEEKQ